MGSTRRGLGVRGLHKEGVCRSMLRPHVSQGLRPMSLAPCLLSPPPPHRSSEPNDSLKGTYSSCPHLPNSFFLVLQSKNLPPSAKGVTNPPFPPESWIGLSMDTCPQLSSLTSAPHTLLTPQGQSQSHLPPSKPFLCRDRHPHLQGRGHRAKRSCS